MIALENRTRSVFRNVIEEVFEDQVFVVNVRLQIFRKFLATSLISSFDSCTVPSSESFSFYLYGRFNPVQHCVEKLNIFHHIIQLPSK